jgi:hypothetical protein
MQTLRLGVAESGVGRSVLRLCYWQEPDFIRREDVFIFCKVWTFQSDFQNNAAVN